MAWFTNMKIGAKLACGFGVCLLFATTLGVVSINRMSLMTQTMQAALDDSVSGLHAMARINAEARHLRTLEFQDVLTNSPTVRAGFESDMATSEALVQSAMDEYGSSLTDPVDTKNFNDLKTQWQDYLNIHNSALLALTRSDSDKQAEALLNGEMRVQFHSYTDNLNNMLQWNHARGKWYGRQVKRAFAMATGLILLLLITSLVIATIMARYISRMITTSLHAVSILLERLETVDIAGLRTAVQAMETGDLTVQVRCDTESLNVTSRDEIGAMGQTFNSMLDQVKVTIASFRSSQASLGAMVRSLQSSADQVSTASEALASSSEQMSAGSEQIAGTMQEVATATDQSARGATEVAMGATNQAQALGEGAELVRQLVLAVNSVARDAESTAHSAEQANSVATEGSRAVTEAIEGMQRIRTAVTQSAGVIRGLGEASSQIGAIVGTIEEIADQTNLLALNAAIEAARAGDAGRGFAVVADEVRKLAERSRLATHEIGQLIQRVQSHTTEAVEAMHVGSVEVGKGCELAEGAGAALAQIKAEMSSVSDQVQNICSATEQMLASSEEVSHAISDVTVVVQQSSAAAEEMSASAEEVSASVQTVAGTLAEQTAVIGQLVASSTELSRIAASLKDSAGQFVIEDIAVLPVRPLKLLKAA